MTWHGQINRTIWEIERLLDKDPTNPKLRKELLRTHFLQRYEYDRTLHVPRDDRSFLFMQEEPSPVCLLLHGAFGTPAEMRDLGGHLYSRGYTVFCLRMSRYDAKNRLVTWEAWATMAETALRTVQNCSDHVFLVGLSLGSTISIVVERLGRVNAMVLLAPALYPRLDVKGRLRMLARRFTPTLFYKFSGWAGEVTRAMEYVRHSPAEIKVPTLILQARDDHVLSLKGLKFMRRWAKHPASEVVILPHGSHALTRGKAKEEVFERVSGFLQNVDSSRSAS